MPPTDRPFVLLSWVARNNDPFVRARDGGYVRSETGELLPGPTIELLFSEDSPYRGKVSDVMLLCRLWGTEAEQDADRKIVKDTFDEIRARDERIETHSRYWHGSSPVDHGTIFAFLQERLPEIRLHFAGRPLLINVSPGTPAMHTIWVLMAETGYIDPPFEIVQGIPKPFRSPGAPATVPVTVGIETFYKTYQRTKPEHVTAEEDLVRWDLTKARSDALVKLREDAMRMAGVKVPVLLLGERGTGKTTLATWIRAHSPFRRPELDEHWPMVSCGQFTPELMRSEIFGHRKGAFTGAEEDYEGIAARVDGDTLFLDEIGDVSHDVQRLLIRALEEKTFMPIGSTQPQKSDFRLVTATNRPLDTLRETLDADFLDRISVFRLRMPALRDIPEDIDWIWRDIFAQAAVRSGSDSIRLREKDHERVVSALRAHPMPGNLRDPYRVAYHLVAALADSLRPMDYDDAVDYALQEGLRGDEAPLQSRQTPAQRIARLFAEGRSLDPILDSDGEIPTRSVDGEFRRFLAEEIRRLARQRDVPPDDLCDVSARTLLNWLK